MSFSATISGTASAVRAQLEATAKSQADIDKNYSDGVRLGHQAQIKQITQTLEPLLDAAEKSGISLTGSIWGHANDDGTTSGSGFSLSISHSLPQLPNVLASTSEPRTINDVFGEDDGA